jgi:hypothetical protein
LIKKSKKAETFGKERNECKKQKRRKKRLFLGYKQTILHRPVFLNAAGILKDTKEKGGQEKDSQLIGMKEREKHYKQAFLNS